MAAPNLSWNDKSGAGLTYTAVSGTTAFATTAVRVYGVLLGCTAASATVDLYNATATSTLAGELHLKCAVAYDSRWLWFGPNGVKFGTGLHGKVNATTTTATVLWKADI